MSGTCQDWNGQPGVPGGRAETMAAVAEGLNRAMSALSASQEQAHSFWTSFGDSVPAGHPDTTGPAGAPPRG